MATLVCAQIGERNNVHKTEMPGYRVGLLLGVFRFFPPRCFDGIFRRLIAMGLVTVVSTFVMAQKSLTIPEEVEWTWEVRPPHPDANLPNVLLLGDSISRNYFPEVRKNLSGIANVYLMASSTSVGDPRLEQQIRELQEEIGRKDELIAKYYNKLKTWEDFWNKEKEETWKEHNI